MVAYNFLQRLTPPLVVAGAAALGLIAALGWLVLPTGLLESFVVTSGIAAFIPAAEPPLGMTARLALAAFTGIGVGLIAWFVLATLVDVAQSKPRAVRGPTVRRADAHPDAPPREPLRAGRDLGFEDGAEPAADDSRLFEAEPKLVEPEAVELPHEPVIAMGAPSPAPLPVPAVLNLPADPPPPPAVQPLPANLDQPLAAFDPGALRDTPLAPSPPLAPLAHKPPAPVFEAGERFETFDLAPPPPPVTLAVPPVAPISGPETVATVHSLLDRLERGISRRVQPVEREPEPEPTPEPQGLESTLDALRRMAARR